MTIIQMQRLKCSNSSWNSRKRTGNPFDGSKGSRVAVSKVKKKGLSAEQKKTSRISEEEAVKD